MRNDGEEVSDTTHVETHDSTASDSNSLGTDGTDTSWESCKENEEIKAPTPLVRS